MKLDDEIRLMNERRRDARVCRIVVLSLLAGMLIAAGLAGQ